MGGWVGWGGVVPGRSEILHRSKPSFQNPAQVKPILQSLAKWCQGYWFAYGSIPSGDFCTNMFKSTQNSNLEESQWPNPKAVEGMRYYRKGIKKVLPGLKLCWFIFIKKPFAKVLRNGLRPGVWDSPRAAARILKGWYAPLQKCCPAYCIANETNKKNATWYFKKILSFLCKTKTI